MSSAAPGRYGVPLLLMADSAPSLCEAPVTIAACCRPRHRLQAIITSSLHRILCRAEGRRCKAAHAMTSPHHHSHMQTGSLTPDELLVAGRTPTALSLLTGNASYELTWRRIGNKTCAIGLGGQHACVLYSREVRRCSTHLSGWCMPRCMSPRGWPAHAPSVAATCEGATQNCFQCQAPFPGGLAGACRSAFPCFHPLLPSGMRWAHQRWVSCRSDRWRVTDNAAKSVVTQLCLPRSAPGRPATESCWSWTLC